MRSEIYLKKDGFTSLFKKKRLGSLTRLRLFSGETKRACLVLMLMVISIYGSKAQSISDYNFAASSGTFTALSSPSYPTITGSTTTGYFNGIPIGFDFWFMGDRYTTVSASVNGWLTLGANITSAAASNSLLSYPMPRPGPIIAPLWDDLDIQAASRVSYKTTGTAGSRIFTIQYLQVKWSSSAYSAGLSFQVRLYEGSGKVEYVYKQETGSLSSASASIGIAAATTGYGNFRSLNNAGTSPTASSTTSTTSISTKPASGQTYAFTSPVPTVPSGLTFTSVASTSMTLNWTDNSTNDNGFAIYRSDDGGVTYNFIEQTATSATSSVQTNLTASKTYYWKIYSVTEGALSSTALTGSKATACSIANNILSFVNGVNGDICATPAEGSSAILTAPAGTVFTTVSFASYGVPSGTCSSFTIGTCHATTSQSVAESYLLGNNTASIPATNAVFGDPCVSTTKMLYVQAAYTQPLCSGSVAGTITGGTPTGGSGSYTYYWERSTTGPTSGFTAAPGTNNTKDYSPGVLTQNTWYRRTVTSVGCSDVSPVLMISVIPAPSVSGTSTLTCVGGSTGTITATGSGGTSYTYSLNSGAYQTSALFNALAAGTYTLNAKSNTGCVASTSVIVSTYATSTDDQNTSGTDTWIGHVYDGINFNNYIGHYNKTETFNESNGLTCLNLTSGSSTSSIYTETYSVKYRMNSTKKGLYVVDLGSDDGSRLTVDGTMVYNNWVDNAFSSKPRVLISLNGASSLLYEFYNNTLGSQVAFENLTLVFANNLSTNTTQQLCIGSTGLVIGGDTYGTLPAGTTQATYQWSYSTTPGGSLTPIAGATGATFSPSAAVAPFNVAGTYYIYRSASLSTSNNTGVSAYVATNVSNAATVTTVATSATISYAGTPYCSSSGTATVTLTGNAGGTFSSTTLGSALNVTNGNITLASAPAGTHTITYKIPAMGSCAAYTATTTITITTQPWVTGNFPGNPYCTNYGIAYPTGAKGGADGTISAQAGLTIDPSTGVVNLGASSPGSYTLAYTVPASGGCATYTATYNLVIIGSPSATISYTGSPFCTTAGIVTANRTGTAGGVFSAAPAGLSIDATTGSVNTLTSTPGTYTVTYNIAAAGSCAAFSTTTSITVGSDARWTGAISKLWNVTANWQCGVIPTSTTNVIIPKRLANYPVINIGIVAMCNNLTLEDSTSITNNGTLRIAGTQAPGAGASITASAGKVEFNGTTLQTVPAGLFKLNVIKDLTITNAADVTLAGLIRVTNSVGFGGVNNSILNSNGFLTLVSTATSTANYLDATNGGVNSGNKIAGDVIVERYMQGKRAYRFLTAPVNSTTSIKTNWMEGVSNLSSGVNNNPVLNYGTHITGANPTVNGFDATQTNNASMYTFNSITQAWLPIPNTSGLFSAGTGYRIIVRGSRSTDLNNNNATPSSTTLRAKGTLVTGPVIFTYPGGGGTPGMPILSPDTSAYSFIANPYASSVDWVSLYLNSKDLSPTYYLFDPTISGSNGRGAYVSYNGKLKVKNILSSLVNNDIQSGQGFFVQNVGNNPKPALTFNETDKSTDFLPVFRTAEEAPHITVELLLPGQVAGTSSADGTGVYFSDDYNNSIGIEDSYKFNNQDENLAILRDGTPLSLEGRKSVTSDDSIPLKMWQLTQKSYNLNITVSNFSPSVEAYLQDKYLSTTTALVGGANLVPFTINSEAASAASNRFSIIFETLATLPVRLTGIKAYEKNKGVQVDWVAESESNIDIYEVEKSSDAQHFITIGSVKAKNNPSISTAYASFDINPIVGNNYYRIKTIEKSGSTSESEIIRVNVAGGKSTISVANNPIQGNTINLVFTNAEAGNYTTNLFDESGKMIFNGSINYTGGTSYKSIKIDSYIAPGVYQLQMVNGTTVKNIQILVR